MDKISVLIGLAISASPALAVTITPTIDPTVLAGELLAGAEIKAIAGDGQIGTFSNLVLHGANNTQLALDKGIVLSSGYLNGLPTSNTTNGYGTDTGGSGDQLINAFPVDKFNHGGKSSSDAALIRLRFIAPDNVTGIVARFIYASEEFPEFSGTLFADGFAFARSETVAGVKQDFNYALLPNGNPVSLLDQSTNIHFMSNGSADDPNIPSITDLEFDGITRILEVRAPVTAGQQEDFTLVVADTGDGIYDSAVFISALSFFNNPGFNFKVGTVTIEDNPASNGFQEPLAAVPLPATAWFFLSGLIGWLAAIRRRHSI